MGVCLERSVEMLVGLLGILKAGGACVPLDSAYPGDRLAYMIEDVGFSAASDAAVARQRAAAGRSGALSGQSMECGGGGVRR